MNELPNNLTFSNQKNFVICCKACNLHWALQNNLSICLLKVSFLSIVIPSRITSSSESTRFEFIT